MSKFKARKSRMINVNDVNVDQFLSHLDATGTEGKDLISANNRKNGTKRHGILDYADRSGEAENIPKSGRAQRSKTAHKAEAAKQSDKTPKTPLAHAAPKPERAKKRLAAVTRTRPNSMNTPLAGAAPKLKRAKKSFVSKISAGPITPNTPLEPVGAIKFKLAVERPNGRTIDIAGVRDERNVRYIAARDGTKTAIMPYSLWHGGSSEASRAMREQNMINVGSMSSIQKVVAQVKSFQRLPIASKPGWFEGGFALSDGRVIAPAGRPKPLIAFSATKGPLEASGDADRWIKEVAEPLGPHLLASFLMMTNFAAPLLSFTKRTENIGLELSGKPGCGKSTLQAVMASAAGPAFGATTYQIGLNKTMNALETCLPNYRDMPLIMDEAALMPGSARPDARAAAVRDMAFRLSAGVVKHRYGEPAGTRSHFVFTISTNRAVASLLGEDHAAENAAILDRLITLPILPERPAGVFDYCPEGFASTGAFADALKQAAASHYGHAMRKYLQHVVNLADRRRDWFTTTIGRMIDRFKQRVGVDTNNGSEARVADAFGLVYVAGCLAKKAGVLPRSYQPFSAAKFTFELHRSHGRPPVTFDDRLLTLLRHPDAIDISEEDTTELPEAMIRQCPVFLYSTRSDQKELLIPINHIRRVFPNWDRMRKDPDVLRRLQRSSDRLTRDRPVGIKGAWRPVYCFDISDLDD